MKLKDHDLNDCLTAFTKRMEERLIEQERRGRRGWNDIDFAPTCRNMLLSAIQRYQTGDSEQLVDIANLAMMVWWHQPNQSQSDEDAFFEDRDGDLG